jgi:hypothetical protein
VIGVICSPLRWDVFRDHYTTDGAIDIGKFATDLAGARSPRMLWKFSWSEGMRPAPKRLTTQVPELDSSDLRRKGYWPGGGATRSGDTVTLSWRAGLSR